jgi:Transposase DDE domain
MYIATVPNRNSPPAILLRESYRENGRVKSRTLANLTHVPKEGIEALRLALKLKPTTSGPQSPLGEGFEIVRTLPHGHVAAALGTIRSLDGERLIDPARSRRRDLVVALIVARIIAPASKLATARGLRSATSSSSLGEVCSVAGCDEDDLYDAMDWLVERQPAIERRLARRHLSGGTLVLYDVSTAAFEGHTCPLGAIGHARDQVKGRQQVVYGLLTTTEGIPIAIEAFRGNTADPPTVSTQVRKLKDRFGLSHIVFVGDRGMVTKARIKEDLVPAGLDWITCLRAPEIQYLVRTGAFQLSLFEEQDLAEISHPDRPGERLIVCRNPNMTEVRRRRREDLLRATERELDRIVAATKRKRSPLRESEKIGLRVGRVIDRRKMAKHFVLEIAEDSFAYHRNEIAITTEAMLDGFYVVRTNVPAEQLTSEQAVLAYKRLDGVERAFRGFNSDLDLRPIWHRKEDRVRAHLLLCMLAYYAQWHMADRAAPILFKDHDPLGAAAVRPSPVAPATRSPAALAKTRRKRTESGHPVHSLATLLADLATVAVNTIQPSGVGTTPFRMVTVPTELQRYAFELLGVDPRFGVS